MLESRKILLVGLLELEIIITVNRLDMIHVIFQGDKFFIAQGTVMVVNNTY